MPNALFTIRHSLISSGLKQCWDVCCLVPATWGGSWNRHCAQHGQLSDKICCRSIISTPRSGRPRGFCHSHDFVFVFSEDLVVFAGWIPSTDSVHEVAGVRPTSGSFSLHCPLAFLVFPVPLWPWNNDGPKNGWGDLTEGGESFPSAFGCSCKGNSGECA